jgi:threonine dehydrogenase-like Zn-dependent dehydrogenase
VGVPHGVQLRGEDLFFEHVHLHGGPAPVRQYLPHLIGLALENKIRPGQVFDLTLPLSEVAEGYRAMDERCAIKALRRWLPLCSGSSSSRWMPLWSMWHCQR